MPVFTVVPPTNPVGPWTTLLVQGEANLLSALDAGNTSSTGAWTATGASLAATGPTAADGSFPIALTSTGGGTISAQSAAYAVVPSQSYSGLAAFQAASTGRSTQAQLVWRTGGGTVISTSSGALSSDFSGSYAVATVSDFAPATAATVALQVTITGTATSEVHYVASRGVFPGVVSTWSEGGDAGNETATVQYSDDAVTWTTLPYANLPASLPAPSQQAKVTDWAPVPNTPRQYRSQVTNSAGKVSPWSTPVTATVVPDRYWLIDVTQPDAIGRVPLLRVRGASGSASGVTASQVWSLTQAQSVNYGLDEQFPVIQKGPWRAPTTTLTCYVSGQANKNALVGVDNRSGLLGRSRTLLLQTDGFEQMYISITPPVTVEILRDMPEMRRAQPQWAITMPVTGVAAP